MAYHTIHLSHSETRVLEVLRSLEITKGSAQKTEVLGDSLRAPHPLNCLRVLELGSVSPLASHLGVGLFPV